MNDDRQSPTGDPNAEPRDSRDPDDVLSQRDELRDDRKAGDQVAEGDGVADLDDTVVDDAGPEPQSP